MIDPGHGVERPVRDLAVTGFDVDRIDDNPRGYTYTEREFHACVSSMTLSVIQENGVLADARPVHLVEGRASMAISSGNTVATDALGY